MDDQIMKEENIKANALAVLIEDSAVNPEKGADDIAQKVEISPENSIKTRGVIVNFIRSYRRKDKNISDRDWLENEFSKYPEIWENKKEIKDSADEIVTEMERYEESKAELYDFYKKGGSQEHWLAGKIEQGATGSGIANFGKYAGEIEHSVDSANRNSIDVIYRNDGQINQQLNLDGFIFEQHHVDSINIKLAAKGSPYRYKVLKPGPGETYGKNSVDIVAIDTRTGKIVQKCQAKCGSDSEATKKLFDNGDYRGQRKLVPKGQSDDIPGSTDRLEIDGVESQPLSKEEAKELQRKAQEKSEAKQYDWNDADRGFIVKNIAKKAGVSALLAVGFQGIRILGRRIWNSITGKENQSAEEDLQEFVESSIKSAASAGLNVAVTGGITVAVKSGWLGKALKNTPAGRIANAVCLGIENIKILYKFATGELTGEEALDTAGSTTCSMLGSIALGTKGMALGASLGTVFGPIGTVIGGLAGGIVGGIAGSTVGEAIWEGGKRIVSFAVNAVKAIGEGISNVVHDAVDFFRNLLPW